jgi:protein-disulfide isomerase-like protein with CxxC motif
MTNVEVFKGRDARAEAMERAAHPAGKAIANATLREQFEIATSIANATEAVPRSYRKQPGAVLLALAWSQQHDLDILTTIQNVAFIEGKAVVDATMQRALAKRAGYELTITVDPTSAAVTVVQRGRALGTATYTLGDADKAGLLGKQNWKRNPEDMLVARATTRAIRRFAPDVLLGMLSSDEVDEGADVVEIAATGAGGVGGVALVSEPPPPDPASDDAPESDAPAASASPPPPTPWADIPWTNVTDLRDDLKARGITNADAIRESHAIVDRLGLETRAGSLGTILAHPSPGFAEAFYAWVVNHDETGS